MKSPGPSLAALLHGVSWACGPKSIAFEPGLTLGPLNRSVEGRLYKRLCAVTGIDDGEPLGYEVYARFDPTEKLFLDDCDDPHSVVNRFYNLLTIAMVSPIGMCRAIWSTDGFASALHTEIAFNAYEKTEFLVRNCPSVTPIVAGELARAWENEQKCWEQTESGGRLIRALEYFYYAWRSPYAEQICLNLGIALQILFGPHAHSSIANPTWVNASCFACESSADVTRVWLLVQRVCRLQAKIVDGAMPDEDELIDVVVHALPFGAGVLKRILLDEKLAHQFNSYSKS